MTVKDFKRAALKYAYTIHRWGGIAVCLLFVSWLLSGLMLAYQPFPKLELSERLARLRPIEWNAVRIGPTEALRIAGQTQFPAEFRLEMSAGRPVYRIVGWHGDHHTVGASDGRRITRVSPEEARAIVEDFAAAPGAHVGRADIVTDQWTIVTSRWINLRPLHRIDTNDISGTSYYVSSRTGEVVLDTNRRERVLNYFGAIPHWFYIVGLRDHDARYRVFMDVIAITGMAAAFTGMWLGINRIRLRKRYPSGAVSPFRGWMKWHHVFGVFGGIALSTWIFSGFLANGWIAPRTISQDELVRFAGHGAPDFPADLRRLGSVAPDAGIAQFQWVAGTAVVGAYKVGSERPALWSAGGNRASFDDRRLFSAAAGLLPGHQIVGTARLEEGDEYWHPGTKKKALPILRVKFDDPSSTWYHIDPLSLQIVGIMDDMGRTDRWLFYFLHDLDLKILLDHRPVWDLVLWSLSLGGLVIAISGVVLGWRRLDAMNRQRRQRKARLKRRPA